MQTNPKKVVGLVFFMRMNPARSPLRAISTSFLLAAITAAQAAPTSDEASSGGNEPTPAIRVPPATSASGNAPGGNQALDLLVQMQSQTASIAPQQNRTGSMRGQAPIFPTTPTAAQTGTAAQQPLAEASNGNSPLFGSGATPAPRAGDSRDESYRSKTSSSGSGMDRSEGRPPSSGNEPRWLFGLPMELLVYIRENREWFLAGALGALALVWAGSAALARRRA